MSYTARPPFTGGMSNQSQQQQQSGQSNNANIGASGTPNMPIMNNAASSKHFHFINTKNPIWTTWQCQNHYKLNENKKLNFSVVLREKEMHFIILLDLFSSSWKPFTKSEWFVTNVCARSKSISTTSAVAASTLDPTVPAATTFATKSASEISTATESINSR